MQWVRGFLKVISKGKNGGKSMLTGSIQKKTQPRGGEGEVLSKLRNLGKRIRKEQEETV